MISVRDLSHVVLTCCLNIIFMDGDYSIQISLMDASHTKCAIIIVHFLIKAPFFYRVYGAYTKCFKKGRHIKSPQEHPFLHPDKKLFVTIKIQSCFYQVNCWA